MRNKIFASADEAIYDIEDGAVIAIHGMIGPEGVPQNLLVALRDKGIRDLTIICASTGLWGGIVRKEGMRPYVSSNLLIESGQVRKLISTWSRRALSSTFTDRSISSVERAVSEGKVEWEPSSHGVLAERLRAGAAGLGGIYSPVGIGTILERGKEKKTINGKQYLLETALRADFALVKAFKADKMGNLIYRGAARSFNPIVAMAGDVTIVEAEHIAEVGEIDPEHIITPGVFVDRIFEIPEGGWR